MVSKSDIRLFKKNNYLQPCQRSFLMVALCAGCNAIYPYAAVVIGVIAGMAYIAWSTVVLKLKIDDPLDAVAVHLGGGIWGVLSVPIFNKDNGILYEGSLHSFRAFGWNLLGVVVIMIWSAALSFVMFITLHLTKQLRVTEEIEIKGLDIPKHGEPAYPLDSYGDGWGSESPSAERKQIPYVRKSTSKLTLTDIQNSHAPATPKENGISNPAVVVVENPTVTTDTAF